MITLLKFHSWMLVKKKCIILPFPCQFQDIFDIDEISSMLCPYHRVLVLCQWRQRILDLVGNNDIHTDQIWKQTTLETGNGARNKSFGYIIRYIIYCSSFWIEVLSRPPSTTSYFWKNAVFRTWSYQFDFWSYLELAKAVLFKMGKPWVSTTLYQYDFGPTKTIVPRND